MVEQHDALDYVLSGRFAVIKLFLFVIAMAISVLLTLVLMPLWGAIHFICRLAGRNGIFGRDKDGWLTILPDEQMFKKA